MSVRRALVATALAPLLGLALAGCQEAEPTPKMPETSAASPTPTETSTAEQESPEEFIRRWAEVNRAMQVSGNTEEYVALSRRCAPCKSTASRIKAIYAAGGYVKTEGWTIERVTNRSGAESAPVLDLRVSSAPTELKESAGAMVETLPGGKVMMRVRLTAGAPWGVVQLTQVAS